MLDTLDDWRWTHLRAFAAAVGSNMTESRILYL